MCGGGGGGVGSVRSVLVKDDSRWVWVSSYTKNHSHVPFKRVNYLSYLKQKQKQNT